MSAPINNQFAGGYQINEKEKNLSEFGNAPDENFDPLKTLDGEELKANGGGMYASFEAPKNDTNHLEEEIKEEGNAEAELEAGLNEADDSLAESNKSKEDVEIVETEREHCRFGPTIDSCTRDGGLTPKESIEAKKALSGLKEGANVQQALEKTGITPTHKAKLTEVVEYMVDPEVQNQNREKFNKDFGVELEELKVKNAEGEKAFEPMTEQAINRLGGNYFVNLDKNGESLNSTQALNRGLKTCIAEIGEKSNNVDTSSVDYKKITYDIQDTSKSFIERCKRLADLENYANTKVVEGGTKNKKDLDAANKRDTEKNNASKDAVQNKENIAQKESAEKKQARLATKAENDIKLAESPLQPKSGEVYVGSELEVGGEGRKVT